MKEEVPFLLCGLKQKIELFKQDNSKQIKIVQISKDYGKRSDLHRCWEQNSGGWQLL